MPTPRTDRCTTPVRASLARAQAHQDLFTEHGARSTSASGVHWLLGDYQDPLAVSITYRLSTGRWSLTPALHPTAVLADARWDDPAGILALLALATDRETLRALLALIPEGRRALAAEQFLAVLPARAPSTGWVLDRLDQAGLLAETAPAHRALPRPGTVHPMSVRAAGRRVGVLLADADPSGHLPSSSMAPWSVLGVRFPVEISATSHAGTCITGLLVTGLRGEHAPLLAAAASAGMLTVVPDGPPLHLRRRHEQP